MTESRFAQPADPVLAYAPTRYPTHTFAGPGVVYPLRFAQRVIGWLAVEVNDKDTPMAVRLVPARPIMGEGVDTQVCRWVEESLRSSATAGQALAEGINVVLRSLALGPPERVSLAEWREDHPH